MSVLEHQFRLHQHQVHVAACVRFVRTVPQVGGPPLQMGPLTSRGHERASLDLRSQFCRKIDRIREASVVCKPVKKHAVTASTSSMAKFCKEEAEIDELFQEEFTLESPQLCWNVDEEGASVVADVFLRSGELVGLAGALVTCWRPCLRLHRPAEIAHRIRTKIGGRGSLPTG